MNYIDRDNDNALPIKWNKGEWMKGEKCMKHKLLNNFFFPSLLLIVATFLCVWNFPTKQPIQIIVISMNCFVNYTHSIPLFIKYNSLDMKNKCCSHVVTSSLYVKYLKLIDIFSSTDVLGVVYHHEWMINDGWLLHLSANILNVRWTRTRWDTFSSVLV